MTQVIFELKDEEDFDGLAQVVTPQEFKTFNDTFVGKDSKLLLQYDGFNNELTVLKNSATKPEIQSNGTTLTEKIFQLNAPYDNPFQGDATRLLFVCSAGILRSATGANLYGNKGYNTRNCGSHNYALIPLSVNLILWAHQIVFVNRENYDRALTNFEKVGYDEDLRAKSIVLNIPDDYEYNHPELHKHFEKQLDPIVAPVKTSRGWSL